VIDHDTLFHIYTIHQLILFKQKVLLSAGIKEEDLKDEAQHLPLAQQI